MKTSKNNVTKYTKTEFFCRRSRRAVQCDQCGHERFVLPFVLPRWRPADETAGAFDEEAREARTAAGGSGIDGEGDLVRISGECEPVRIDGEVDLVRIDGDPSE